MASPAVADLDGIRRFCEVLDATLAASDGAPRGAPAGRGRRKGEEDQWFAIKLRPLQAAYVNFPRHRATSQWADLFVQYELVPHASRLLQRVVDRYAAIQASGGAEGLSATTRRGLVDGDPLLQTLEWSGRVLGPTLEQAAELVHAAGMRTKPYDRLPAAVRRLVEQLGALPTLQALADAVRLVANEALPAVTAAKAAAAGSGMCTLQAATQSARSGSDRPACETAPTTGTTAATPSSPAAHMSPYYLPSCMLLRAAAGCLALPCIEAAVVQAAGAGAAATAASRRQLLSCKVSGVLGALCAAVLAAPTVADLPADLTLVGEAPGNMLQAQLHLHTYLCKVALHQQST
ncbi:hypothetical protein TSOC_014189, partial [Tetrabaena socialis]